MDIYFLPFAIFAYLKIGIFSFLLSKDKKISSLKSKVIISVIGVFLLIGITMFYNLFGLFLLVLLPIVISIILLVNTIKRNYRFGDSLSIFFVFFVNFFVYGCVIFLLILDEASGRFSK